MTLYHISDTLKPGDFLSNGFFKDNISLAGPFVQALNKDENCFYSVF